MVILRSKRVFAGKFRTRQFLEFQMGITGHHFVQSGWSCIDRHRHREEHLFRGVPWGLGAGILGNMKTVIKEVPGYHMINLIEDGETPLLEINELEDIGFKIAVLPLTLMSASVKTMQESLNNIKNRKYNTNVSKFEDLRDVVGFNEYYKIEDKYKS